jgi:hypothetical protein
LLPYSLPTAKSAMLQQFLYIRCLKANISPNYICPTLSPYRAVNTLRLCYKNQPVNAV